MKLKDPYAKKGLPTWKKWLISFIVIAVAFVALWLTNCLSWAGLQSPLPCYNKPDTEEAVEIPEVTAACDSTAVISSIDTLAIN